MYKFRLLIYNGITTRLHYKLKGGNAMNENVTTIPYVVHEGDMSRMERINKRLWILCIVIFLALVITNAGWIYYESQFEEVVTTTTQEVEQDADGIGSNTFVGGDYYGETKSEDNENN